MLGLFSKKIVPCGTIFCKTKGKMFHMEHLPFSWCVFYYPMAVGICTVYCMYPSFSSLTAFAGIPAFTITCIARFTVFRKIRTSRTITVFWALQEEATIFVQVLLFDEQLTLFLLPVPTLHFVLSHPPMQALLWRVVR